VVHNKFFYPKELENPTTETDFDKILNPFINGTINSPLTDSEKTKTELLFDESQALLKNDALLFCRIRWWLCRKRGDNNQVVAVFTRTTSRLSNF
jgi:hypothetical protein